MALSSHFNSLIDTFFLCNKIEFSIEGLVLTRRHFSSVKLKLNFFYRTGLKFRRQHWFFMGCVAVLLIFALALAISLSRGSGASLAQSPELRDAAVAQLLAEVPLVDG
jgi:hypothetical protein